MNNRIIKAVQIASDAHRGQTRQVTGQPYIYHCLRVMNDVLLLPDVTEDMACAAVLHDTLEDTTLTREDIQRQFGKNVGDLVFELTNQFTKKQCPHLNRRIRKDHELLRLGSISHQAKLIKLCDRIDNLSDAPFSDDEGLDFRQVYLQESHELLEEIGSANQELATRLLKLIEKHQPKES